MAALKAGCGKEKVRGCAGKRADGELEGPRCLRCLPVWTAVILRRCLGLHGLPSKGHCGRDRVLFMSIYSVSTALSRVLLSNCFLVATVELPVPSGRCVFEMTSRALQASAPRPPSKSFLQAGLALLLGQARCEPLPTQPPGYCFLTQPRRGDSSSLPPPVCASHECQSQLRSCIMRS